MKETEYYLVLMIVLSFICLVNSTNMNVLGVLEEVKNSKIITKLDALSDDAFRIK